MADKKAKYSFSPRLQKRMREKLWFWVWSAAIAGGLVLLSAGTNVNVLNSSEIASTLIETGATKKQVSVSAGSPGATGIAKKGETSPEEAARLAEKAKAEEKGRKIATNRVSKVFKTAQAELKTAEAAFTAAKSNYDKLRKDDAAAPAQRLAAKEAMNKADKEQASKQEAFLSAKASLEALKSQSDFEQARKRYEDQQARDEAARKAATQTEGSMEVQRSFFSLVIEYILMVGLWAVFVITLAGVYLVYCVRRAAFYRNEEDRSLVIQALAKAFKEKHDPVERYTFWKRAQRGEKMAAVNKQTNHLAEITNEIGDVAISSPTALDRYFMAQARDIKEEEYGRLSMVNMCAALGPILGFSGTVLGMIIAFSQLGSGKISEEMIGQISLAINVALVTTLLGLLVKGFGLLIKTWVRNQIDAHASALFLIPSEVVAWLARETDALSRTSSGMHLAEAMAGSLPAAQAPAAAVQAQPVQTQAAQPQPAASDPEGADVPAAVADTMKTEPVSPDGQGS